MVRAIQNRGLSNRAYLGQFMPVSLNLGFDHVLTLVIIGVNRVTTEKKPTRPYFGFLVSYETATIMFRDGSNMLVVIFGTT